MQIEIEMTLIKIEDGHINPRFQGILKMRREILAICFI